MMKDYNLSNIGIVTTLNLFGSLTMLNNSDNCPIVFLFDENHDNPNECFNKNAANAKELIEKANVVLVGVESHLGGREWDQYEEGYLEDSEYGFVCEKTRTNTHPEFAYALAKIYPNMVYGVESFGLLGKIQSDYAVNHPRAVDKEVRDHEFQKERSRHFIKTLFEIYNKIYANGNLILNCGRDHNSHIEEWIEDGQIDEIAGIKARYIRIYTFD
jgi:hypothetical protein